MRIRKLHYYSGLIIALFILLHLVNHSFALIGIDKHIEIMQMFRKVYRNIFAETILLLAIVSQIFSGIQLFRDRYKKSKTFFEKIQVWSGLYMAFFFVIHLSAIMAGRFLLDLDTNFYFGAAGLNRFPYNLFFIPYYSLAILSFFGHIASIHYKKMKLRNRDARTQSFLIILIGFVVTLLLMYGLTNGFKGVTIPPEYGVLVGE